MIRLRSNILVLLTLLAFSSCTTEPEKIQTGWEYYNLQGKVRRMEKREGVVTEYKFGEPVFEMVSSEINEFNEFGYTTKFQTSSTEEYSAKQTEFIYHYNDEKKGLLEKTHFKGISLDGEELASISYFIYDPISEQQLSIESENLITGMIERKVYDYGQNENQITYYDSEGKLEKLVKYTYDKSENLINKYISYDKDGSLDFESYTFYQGSSKVKDSIVYPLLSTNVIEVNLYDTKGRLKSSRKTRFKNNFNNLVDYSELTYEYESNSKNSSYTLREYNDLNNTLKSEYRFQKNLDEMGNVIEEFKINMATNKIEEGISYTINYF